MTKRVLFLFAASCCAIPPGGVAQSSTPPPSPVPSVAPGAPPSEPASEKRPGRSSQPGVFLGVDTVPVPAALSDQLNLPAGFGLLVDYVVAGSPAEVAGVKTHDILKMLNDQILTSEEQLSVLVRSFPEGRAVNLVLLRKGQETRVSATLQKRPAYAGDHPADRRARWRRDEQTDDLGDDFRFDLDDVSSPESSERLRASIEKSRAKLDAATARAQEQAKRAMELALDRTARATGSRLDYDDARILLRDATGRIEIRSAHGKRVLTLRDADGKKTFEGPINTPEQRKAIPADVLPQVEALEREQVTTFPKGSNDRDEDEDGND